jgi:hypothetical protein
MYIGIFGIRLIRSTEVWGVWGLWELVFDHEVEVFIKFWVIEWISLLLVGGSSLNIVLGDWGIGWGFTIVDDWGIGWGWVFTEGCWSGWVILVKWITSKSDGGIIIGDKGFEKELERFSLKTTSQLTSIFFVVGLYSR